MPRRLLPLLQACALLATIGASPGPARAGGPERPTPGKVLIVVGTLPELARGLLARLQAHTGLWLHSPPPVEVPARDALLHAARRSYASMEFQRTATELQAAEARLIDGEVPSPERVARLAEIELFIGATQLLDRDRKSADERFALARALQPGLKPDPIFPPEVAEAYGAARPGPLMSVEAQVAPEGARLWLDGTLGPDLARTTVGLHYVVVERADRKPAARIVRFSKSSSKVELAAPTPAPVERALGALVTRPVSDQEGLAVSRLAGATVWRLTAAGATVEARRFAAADLGRPTTRLSASATDTASLDRELCAIDRCDAVVPPEDAAVVTAPPPRPLTRRPWFWAVVGVGAAIVVGAAVTGAVLGTQPRDYTVEIQ